MEEELEESWLGLDLNGRQPKLNRPYENIGHNSLVNVVQSARKALDRVYASEEMSWEAWREYGKALNEGRGAFPSDEDFGRWVLSEGLGEFVCNKLLHTKSVTRPERAAAMWLASKPEEEQEAISLFPSARTPRGLYTKWLAELKKREDKPNSNPNLRPPDEKEEKRIRNLKDRAASTTSEPERDAALNQIAKMKEDGINVDMVMDQKGEDEERDEYFDEKRKREGAAERLARHFLSKNSVRHIRHLILVAYPETKDLEQFELDILEGETNV